MMPVDMPANIREHPFCAWDNALVRSETNMPKLTTIEAAREPGYYGVGDGLWLRVGPKRANGQPGSKSWVFRYRAWVSGRYVQREMGLGPLKHVSLFEARAEAAKYGLALYNLRSGRPGGYDPLQQREAEQSARRIESAKAITFRECAERYIEEHAAGWRNPRSRTNWTASLEAHAYPVIGDLPVQSIDVGLVMKAVEPIWTKKPPTASKLRQRIEAVLDWATAREYREGDNPARWKGHLENLLPRASRVRPTEHRAALPYSEVASFIAALRAEDGVVPWSSPS